MNEVFVVSIIYKTVHEIVSRVYSTFKNKQKTKVSAMSLVSEIVDGSFFQYKREKRVKKPNVASFLILGFKTETSEEVSDQIEYHGSMTYDKFLKDASYLKDVVTFKENHHLRERLMGHKKWIVFDHPNYKVEHYDSNEDKKFDPGTSKIEYMETMRNANDDIMRNKHLNKKDIVSESVQTNVNHEKLILDSILSSNYALSNKISRDSLMYSIVNLTNIYLNSPEEQRSLMLAHLKSFDKDSLFKFETSNCCVYIIM